MIGGQGLPNEKDLRVRDGRVVVAPLEAPLPKVVQLVTQPKHPDFAKAKEAFADLATKGSPKQLNALAPDLRNLA